MIIRRAPSGLGTITRFQVRTSEVSRVPARILDGKVLAQTVRDEVSIQAAEFLKMTGRAPGLTVVHIGEDPASKVYVRNKKNACKAAGIVGSVITLPEDVQEEVVVDTIAKLNGDPKVDGILVQLPLPANLNETRIINLVSPLKDVDGFHIENAGLLAVDRPKFVPCTPLGIRELLIANGIETKGKHAVVLGRSQIVGKSMALLLLRKGQGGDATVTVCHSASVDVPAIARQADILIAAIGKPEMVRADWVKPGAVVVDVGIHPRDGGGVRGDVAYDEVAEIASWISPVPGGVGPMTIAMLLKNTMLAAQLSIQ